MGPVRPPSRQAKGGPSPPPSGGKPTPASWGGGIPFTDGAPRGREQSQGAPPRAGTRSRRCCGSCPTPLRGGPRVTAPHAALAGHGTGGGGGGRSGGPAGPQRALTSLPASPGTEAQSRRPRQQDLALSLQPLLRQTPPLCPRPLSKCSLMNHLHLRPTAQQLKYIFPFIPSLLRACPAGC